MCCHRPSWLPSLPQLAIAGAVAYGLSQTVFKSKNVQQPAQQAKQAVQENVGKDKGEERPESPLLAPVRPPLLSMALFADLLISDGLL